MVAFIKISDRLNLLKLLFVVYLSIFFSIHYSFAQKDSAASKDTFFLAKKKGWLGKLGKSISTSSLKDTSGKDVIKGVNQFNKYKGYIIRNIQLTQIGLSGSVNNLDTANVDFFTKAAKAFHSTTLSKVIYHNLFFKEGDALFPELFTDNEKYLREQVYLEDARIIVLPVKGTSNEVNVFVVTKDVFSIGGTANIFDQNSGELTLSEDNIGGSGNRLDVKSFYDNSRREPFGSGADFLKRNIAGSFTDVGAGFQTYAPTFNLGGRQENITYLSVNKNLVSAYFPYTFSLNLSHHETFNQYKSDSLYLSDLKYEYNDFDGWVGYNLGAVHSMYKNLKSRLRRFVALRVLNQHFINIPQKYVNNYNFLYANITAVLGSFTLFQQDFYKTKYIYGFGRNEDVPEGINASFIGGWTNKEQRERLFSAFDIERYYFSSRGNYYNYIFKVGTYWNAATVEDANILVSLNYFSRLKRLSAVWNQRTYVNASITTQFNTILNAPLLLSGSYGLPFFNNTGIVNSNGRATITEETVFFNSRSVIGFRFAPFIGSNISFLKPLGQDITKCDGYTGISAGLRSRNENLIFGTMELRVSYFPRTTVNMAPFRIDFNTNLQFKYNSQYVKSPDFITVN